MLKEKVLLRKMSRNKNGISILLMILILSMSIIPIINAEQEVFDAEGGFVAGINGYPWLCTTFYSNYTKMFYAFFQYNRPLVGHTAYYTYSRDGIIWANETRLFWSDAPTSHRMGNGDWDIYIEPNGRYIHVAFLDYENYSPNAIMYFKRELFLNGSLGVLDGGLDAPQNIMDTDLGAYGEASDCVDITLDNESYAYITFESNDAGVNSGFLIQSDYPIPFNGVWEHDNLTLDNAQPAIFGNLWDNDFEVMVTTNGDGVTETGVGRGVHWIVVHENSFGSAQEAIRSARNYYNGSGWYEENCGDSNLADHEGGDWADNLFDVVSIGNMTILAHQTENGNDFIQLNYGVRIGTNDWTNEFSVSPQYPGDDGSMQIHPKIAIDYNRNILFVWNIVEPDNNTVWYRIGRIHFNGSTTWTTNTTEWESWDTFATWEYVDLSSGQSEPLGVNVPLSMTYDDDVDNNIYHDYLFPNDGELEIPYKYDNTTLTSDGWILDDEWIFMGEKYLFTSYVGGGTTFELSFNDGYDTHTIKMNFENNTQTLSTSNDENDEFVTGLYFSNYTLLSDNFTQEIIWGWIPEKNIVDDVNTSVSYILYNEEFNVTLSGDTGISFNIYNLGGLVAYDFNGGGRTVGGEPFELWCDDGNGNYSYAETIFRKLQHVHFLAELDYDPTWLLNRKWGDYAGDGWVTFGIDYRIDSTWVEGWECQIYIQESQVGHYAGAKDASFIKMNVEWYNRGIFIKQDTIYAYSYGYFPSGGNESDRTTFNFWVDLWFNKMNASSVVGGRVNAYQYGMREEGWWVWSSFSPVIGNVTASMFFDDLYDGTNNVTTVRNIELIRFRTTLNRTGNYDSRWRLYPYEVFNYKTADDRMEGLDTPVFVETTVIDMPKIGFVAPIVKAIQAISTGITRAMFNVVKIMIGALDTFIVDILHSPVSMSQMIEWVMIQGSYITMYLSTILLYVSQMLTVFSQMIEFVVSIITYFTNIIIWVMTTVIPFPIHVIRFIIAIINGNSYTIGYWTWNLGDYSELIQGALTIGSISVGYMFTLWILWGNMYGEGEFDMEGLPKRIIMMFQYLRETFQSVFWIFNRMRNEIISIYNFIRSHIPQIGGGGGETTE
jgi:hypothetical protein